ncbi:MAG: hypothetical protein OFPI_00440 [Osedax symbiont Rs2]|nr:MAG: hypothetical protein OFPI_00440 [Osedax symbiont Rs2]
MQESSWKYKRIINRALYSLRGSLFTLKIIKNVIFYIRLVTRKAQQVKPDLSVEKIYSENGKYLYIANPKVATRSVIDYLTKFDKGNIAYKNLSLGELFKKHPKIMSYYKFSFVRNPWARTYSCWVDKITNQNKFCDIIIISRFKGLYPDMPFPEFVNWLSTDEGQDKFADRHWMSQSKLLEFESGDTQSVFIGKLENIENDFKLVARKLSIGPVILPVLNKTQISSLAYRDHYTDNLKEIIARRYKEDIKRYNYFFEQD